MRTRTTPSEAAFERELVALRDLVARRSSAAPGDSVSAFVTRQFSKVAEYRQRDPYATIGDARTFHTKVVGVSFEGRQDVLAGLREGAALTLERQPGNPHDANAIAVRYGALQIGFIRAPIAKRIAPHIDAGALYRARIETLTGGSGKHRGVNIFVERDPAGIEDGALRARDALRASWAGDRDRVRHALIGDHQPHAAQRQALARIADGKNVLVVMGTGRGKSFCFQSPAALAALESGEKTVVIYPLRALANDQHEALARKLDPLGLRVFRANGSIDGDARARLFDALQSGAWDIVLATPEFLEFHRGAFSGKSRPGMVVVDEAHHLFESRHRAAYGRLGETIDALGARQTIALTATARREAFDEIVRALHVGAWVIDPTVRENLHVVDARETKDKIGYLHALFDREEKGIIYCNSRKEVMEVAEKLRKASGETTMFYHGGMSSSDRRTVEDYFRGNEIRVVVATSAFGEGIDLPDVRHVVLYHMNFDFTEFNQQAGRAGRDGDAASIHLLYGKDDRRVNEFLIELDNPSLPTLRAIFRALKGIARDDVVRLSSGLDRTLELDKVRDKTLAAALRIFEEVGLLSIGADDDGDFARFTTIDGKVDLERSERHAEGQAVRESFEKFCQLALEADAATLERIINRPIYPERIDLLR